MVNLLTFNINPLKLKNMKRQFITWGMMLAAAFTLTNCAKEIEDPNQQPEKQGYPFEIVASTVDTKTVNEGMATKWDDDDAINLFHAEAGAEVYGANDKFTIADVEACRFTGELTAALETTKSYDWYALYPYNSNIATPGDRADGYTYIGHSKGLNQTGYDNMASLKETICPLYGVAKAVASSDTPSITMNHLTSVVAIKVTNTTEEPLTITTASLTAEENIVGSYFIDITKSPVVYKASEGFVENTAVVNVSDGTALAKGESATLYLAIKPFTAKAGTSLTLSVNDYAKEPKDLTSDVTFHAGKIKTLNFKYDKAPTPHVTWDLTQDSYSSAAAGKVTWTSDYVNLSLEQGESSSPANNYLGGTNAHTRVYKDHVMTFAPVGKYKIEKIEYFVTETSYVDELTNSTWTNANVSSSGTTVTVIPDDGHSDVSVTIGAATRFTAISVYYSLDEDYVLPTVESIVVSGQTTEFIQNATFGFDGTVTAIYTNDKEVDVTENVTVSTPDLTTTGTKEVTVTYMDGETPVTATYEITVVEASAVSGWILTSFADLKEGDQVVIVGTKSSKQYAMSNDNGTGSGPSPIEVTISGNKLANDPESNIIWYVGEDAAYRIFYASAAKDTWLYCTSTNNGVKVGNNENKTFAWSNDYLQHVGTSRYLGIYNTQDWRCYTSHTATNIANQTFQFYVKVGGSDGGTEEPDPTPTPVELIMSEVTCSGQTENSLTFTWAGVEGATAYQVYFDSEDKGQITELTYTASELEAGTSHTIAVKAVGDNVNYTTSSTAKTCTASTKTAQGEGGGDSQVLTKKISFSAYAAGTQYAQGETHDLGDGFTLTINGGHLNTQVRLYAESNATVQSPGVIQKLDVTAGYKAGTLTVYGSTNGEDWTEVQKISTTTSYTKYSVDMSSGNYTWVKFASSGAQIRLSLLDVTYQN